MLLQFDYEAVSVNTEQSDGAINRFTLRSICTVCAEYVTPSRSFVQRDTISGRDGLHHHDLRIGPDGIHDGGKLASPRFDSALVPVVVFGNVAVKDK